METVSPATIHIIEGRQAEASDCTTVLRSLEAIDAKGEVEEERGINLAAITNKLKLSPAKKATAKKAGNALALYAEATSKKIKAFEYSGLEDRGPSKSPR
ncbi:unnamed protein product [Phytophthora lilii]|uniref:Unnamed protein product n=1 Tax=Phytophthora lilii TaxID=2077276 RepID=A0A9W6TB26_9STRA|nr:unnamed protein product [Phytophthora lilii]